MSKQYLGTHNGLHMIVFDPQNLDIVYWDRPRSQASIYSSAFSCGFFANYHEVVNGKRENFTLPVGNLACSIEGEMPKWGKHYIEEWTNRPIVNNRIEISANQGTPPLKSKFLSTLIIDGNNRVSIQDINLIPPNTKLAISGAPCIMNGDDVDFHKYVLPQGWGADIFRPTLHNWLAIKGQKIYLIAGNSKTPNMIYGMWFWNQVRDMGFDACILLDGGGSQFCRYNNKWIVKAGGDRQINNIGVIR